MASYVVFVKTVSNILEVKKTTSNGVVVPVEYATQQLAFDAVKAEYPDSSIYVAKLQTLVETDVWTDPT
jgi:hypothetical protein